MKLPGAPSPRALELNARRIHAHDVKANDGAYGEAINQLGQLVVPNTGSTEPQCVLISDLVVSGRDNLLPQIVDHLTSYAKKASEEPAVTLLFLT